jgi:predicted small lipoprotein YifL
MKSITRPTGRLLVTLLLGPLIAIAGCGQKGPLYLPGDPSEMQTVVPGTEGVPAEVGNDEDPASARDEEEQQPPETSADGTGTTS